MNKLFLRKKISDRIHQGHNWVYDNEVGDFVGDSMPGGEVSVFSNNGSFVGKGWYNGNSKIRVRIMTRDAQENLDAEFFKNKINQAISIRQTGIIKSLTVRRLFHSESDLISGLMIDQLSDQLVVQCLTKGLDLRYDLIVESLVDLGWNKDKIIKDDHSKIRRFESLDVNDTPDLDTIDFKENGIQYQVNNPHQFSIDRRQIRDWLLPLVQGKNVWDICCGNGNIGYACALQGATSVLLVDNDPNVASINGLETLSNVLMVQQNAFQFLKSPTNERPDIIILDMPVFNVVDDQLKPYAELGYQSLKKLVRNGILVIGISSSKISEQNLNVLLLQWMERLRCSLQIVFTCGAPEDFPTHPLYAHTKYLQFFALRKLD